MSRINKNGGILKGIEEGTIQQDIARQAFEMEEKIQSGEKVIVGVNKFVSDQKEHEAELHKISRDVIEKQVQKLKDIKAQRNNGKVKKAMDELRLTAIDGGNLIPPIISATREYATMGEICSTLKEIFGEYREVA